MAFMVVVNNPGSWTEIYGPFKHAAWHGCTPTDLVFPFFLFIVGVSMAISLRRFETNPMSKELWARIFRRVAMLVGLGLLLALIPNFDFAHLRIPGVLQRIGLCILLATPLVVVCRGAWLAIVGATILLAYALVIVLIRCPNAAGQWGVPTLEPDHNLIRVIDQWLFGPNHLYSRSPTDPEGLLSTLPAVVTVLMGVHSGRLIVSRLSMSRPTGGVHAGTESHAAGSTALGLLVEGLVWAVLGIMLSLILPLNKSLWTPSYVLFSGGLAGFTLGLMYWVIDVRGIRGPTRWLEAMGENAILLFFASGVVGRLMGHIHVGDVTLKAWVYQRGFLTWLSAESASMAFALSNLTCWALVLWVLWKKRWIWRV